MSKFGTNLIWRVISSVILVPVVLLALFVQGPWFFALVVTAISLATWEYVQLIARLGYQARYIFGGLLTITLLCGFYWPNASFLGLAVGLIIVAALAWHVCCDQTATMIQNWSLPLAGAIYTSWTAGHLLLIRALPESNYLLFMMMMITWVTDSAAYFVGKAWGQHLLAPRISPKKTWEGYAGGVVFGALGGLVLAFLGQISWIHGLGLGFLIAVLSPLGDLSISMLKRQANVKDSGQIIPGHGGILDRIDSLLISALVGYYYIVWVMHVITP